jgi:hypothetical protein
LSFYGTIDRKFLNDNIWLYDICTDCIDSTQCNAYVIGVAGKAPAARGGLGSRGPSVAAGAARVFPPGLTPAPAPPVTTEEWTVLATVAMSPLLGTRQKAGPRNPSGTALGLAALKLSAGGRMLRSCGSGAGPRRQESEALFWLSPETARLALRVTRTVFGWPRSAGRRPLQAMRDDGGCESGAAARVLFWFVNHCCF